MASVEQSNGGAGHTTNGTAGDHSKTKSELPAPDPSNPFHFPPHTLPKGIFFNGVQAMSFPVEDDPVTHLQNIQNLTLRDDDVIITAYPKCGTHWVAEILHMLTTGTTEFSGRTKEYTMLEFVNDLPFLSTLPSPRLLNSHLYVAHLPKEIVEKKIKMVHLIRNPKDTAVSLYYHLKQFTASEKFTFENFLKGYIRGKYTSLSHQFTYLRQMAEFERAHPDQPIMHVYYEDLKQDPAPVIKELSLFLGVPRPDDFCQAVASACGFSNMKEADDTRRIPDNIRALSEEKLRLYRKGIGDWKNQFTVALNEIFDDFLAEQEKLGFGFTPRGLKKF